MAKISYVDQPSPVPEIVYCDSSFLVDLFAAASPNRLKTHPDPTRAKNAQNFFVWARQQQVPFVTSVLALEEICNVLLFSEIRQLVSKRGLSGWKALRAADQPLFANLLTRGRAVVGAFHMFYRGLGTRLISTRRTNVTDDSQPPRRVYRYARALLAIHELDAMDAFHIATARFCGVDWAATSDADWASVPNISVISA